MPLSKLSSRSIIHVRWSTSPDCVGYANSPAERERAIADLMEERPSFTGTPCAALAYMRKTKSQLGGALSTWLFSRADGSPVDRADLEQIEFEQDVLRGAGPKFRRVARSVHAF